MKKLFLGSFVLAACIFLSCGSDNLEDCTASSFSSEVNAAITALNNAGQTWANDATSANCEAYKDAANDYLDVVEDLEGCAGISQTDYDAAIDSARDAVDAIGC